MTCTGPVYHRWRRVCRAVSLVRRGRFRSLVKAFSRTQKVLAAALWLELFMRANFERGRSEGLYLNRGQYVMGRGELAERPGVNESRVRRLLDKLVEWGELTKDPTNRGQS